MLGLSSEAWLTLATVVVVLFLLVRDWIAPDVAMLAAVAFLAVVGILTPGEAMSGFVNDGTIAIGALFVVAAGVRETGMLDRVGRMLFGQVHTEKAMQLRLASSVLPISAFMNNTPVVAMFMPLIVGWSRAHRMAPSRFLIPLSYLSMLGGCITLIGTSTNITVDGLLREANLEGLGMFEIAPVGIPMAIAGVLYLTFVAKRLLPDREDLVEQMGECAREYLIDMRVAPASPLIGKGVEAAGLRHLPGLFLIEITRGKQIITPVSPTEEIEENDILTFTGVVSTIVDLERIPGIEPVGDEAYERRDHARRESHLVEAVVSATSPLIGKNVRDADFRALYNAAILAVHRGGKRLRGRVGDIVLENGDTLLLQAGPHFVRAHRNNSDFYLVSGVDESRAVRQDRQWYSLAILLGFVLTVSFGLLTPMLAAVIAAVLMVVSQCVSVAVARQSIDLQTLLTVAGAIGLGVALDRTGAAAAIAQGLVSATVALGPYFLLAVIYVVGVIVTEAISNNGAAALMFPIALAVAAQTGTDPRPFLMAVLFSASMGFITPVGYQTNLMVYGPGGYRFTDFVRAGFPLSMLVGAIAIVLIPWFWPFHPGN